MSGNFIAVPLNTRFAMVRVESVAYSIDDGGTRRRARGPPSRCRHGIDVELRNEMVMHVDPRLGVLRGRACRAANVRHRPQAQSGDASQEVSAPGSRRRTQALATHAAPPLPP